MRPSNVQSVAFILTLCSSMLVGQTKLRTPASPLIPPKLLLETSFADASGDQVLASEEQGTVNVYITNAGGEARKVTIRVRLLLPVRGLVVDSTATLASLQTGRKESLSFVIWATDEVQSGKVSLIVEADDVSKAGFASTRVEITLRAEPGPNLVIGKVRVNSRTIGNAGVGLKIGKNALDVEIKNIGARKARGVAVTPSTTAPFVVLSPAGTALVGELPPGGEHRISVAIEVSQQFPLRSLIMNIQLAEHRQRYSAIQEVVIPVVRTKAERR